MDKKKYHSYNTKNSDKNQNAKVYDQWYHALKEIYNQRKQDKQK